MLERLFHLKDNRATVKTEVIGGIATFMTMCYIIFVQPAILGESGMDFGAVMTATCLASALGTLYMAFAANYPIALAPAMGHNFYFALAVCVGMGIPWQKALGAVFISGVLFIALSFVAFRETIFVAVPECLKNAIAVGIGLLIARVGFKYAGFLAQDVGGMGTGLAPITSSPVVITMVGLAVTSILLILRVKGAIIFGILASTAVGLLWGKIKFQGVASLPPSLDPTLFKLDIHGAWDLGLATVIFIFFFLDVFDTVGTLVGVGSQAGFLIGGKLPRAKQAFLADAFATTAGACLGTSTVVSYIESAAGIAEGARTGLANLVTGILFILALFFSPLVKMVGSGYEVSGGIYVYPTLAPALIVVGVLMMRGVARINWEDFTEALPAFMTIIVMPLALAITEGIAFGFILYTLLKLLTGRGREVHWVVYVCSALFIVRYLLPGG